MTEQIKVTQDGAVLEIVFARPDKKNALSNAMYGAATAALTAAQKNPAIRVVLFAAEGDRILARMERARSSRNACRPTGRERPSRLSLSDANPTS
jgi:1,4-dihydroxy-2-naphthoyl-CoA synthase